jgi:hypothetical protein
MYKPEAGEHVERMIHVFNENVKNFEEEVSLGIGILAKTHPSRSIR